MSHTMKPVTFWTDTIVIGEVESASDIVLFHSTGRTLGEIACTVGWSLYEFDDHYLLRHVGGSFVEFYESGAHRVAGEQPKALPGRAKRIEAREAE